MNRPPPARPSLTQAFQKLAGAIEQVRSTPAIRHPGRSVGKLGQPLVKTCQSAEAVLGRADLLLQGLELSGQGFAVHLLLDNGQRMGLRGRASLLPKDAVNHRSQWPNLFLAVPDIAQDPQVRRQSSDPPAQKRGGGYQLQDLDGTAIGESDPQVAHLEDRVGVQLGDRFYSLGIRHLRAALSVK